MATGARKTFKRSLVDLENLPEPDELADSIISNLEDALTVFKTLDI